MPTIRTCLSFSRGALRLATPWAGTAVGAIVVNDEPVTAPWSRDASGQPVCRHGPWQLTLVRQGRGLTLEIANAGTEPCRLRTAHFGRWTPGAFAPRLQSLDFRELIHGGSFRAINSGVKVVGRRAPGLAAGRRVTCQRRWA